MINSTLTEQKAAALFLFSSIETGLFRVERALPMDENRKSGFYPNEPII